MVDFSKLSVLQQRTGEVERPKPIPNGTYDAVVTAREFGESNQKKTPYVRFTFGGLSPNDDVDHEALAGYGGMAKLGEAKPRVDYYLTADALFRLTDMLKRLGLSDSNTVEQNIEQAMGKPCKIVIHHRPSQDNSVIYAEVRDVLPA